LIWIVTQPLRASDSFGDIRDNAVAPPANLITEEPKTPCPTAPDGTLCNHAPSGTLGIAHCSLFDHEPSPRNMDFER
jgi:hypothetical protein